MKKLLKMIIGICVIGMTTICYTYLSCIEFYNVENLITNVVILICFCNACIFAITVCGIEMLKLNKKA